MARIVVVGAGFAGFNAARRLPDVTLRLGTVTGAAVTRGYHLLSMPGNRGRTGIEWLIDAVAGRPPVQLGLVRSSDIPLETV